MADIIGSKVILFQERIEVGPLTDLIINPEDGAFIGIFVFDYSEKRKMVIPTSEIKAIGNEFVLINDLRSLSEKDDVVSIKEALKINPKIIGEKVVTESGQYLGKVANATIDLKTNYLSRLYVNPPFSISAIAKQLLISRNNIIEIKKKIIVVSDAFSRSKKSFKAAVATCSK